MKPGWADGPVGVSLFWQPATFGGFYTIAELGGAAVTELPRLKALVRLAATCPDLAAFTAQV